MNEIEREAIILNSAWGMIDGMVNWAMFVKNDDAVPTNLLFETSQHSLHFIILLGTFCLQFAPSRASPCPLA